MPINPCQLGFPPPTGFHCDNGNLIPDITTTITSSSSSAVFSSDVTTTVASTDSTTTTSTIVSIPSSTTVSSYVAAPVPLVPFVPAVPLPIVPADTNSISSTTSSSLTTSTDTTTPSSSISSGVSLSTTLDQSAVMVPIATSTISQTAVIIPIVSTTTTVTIPVVTNSPELPPLLNPLAPLLAPFFPNDRYSSAVQNAQTSNTMSSSTTTDTTTTTITTTTTSDTIALVPISTPSVTLQVQTLDNSPPINLGPGSNMFVPISSAPIFTPKRDDSVFNNKDSDSPGKVDKDTIPLSSSPLNITNNNNQPVNLNGATNVPISLASHGDGIPIGELPDSEQLDLRIRELKATYQRNLGQFIRRSPSSHYDPITRAFLRQNKNQYNYGNNNDNNNNKLMHRGLYRYRYYNKNNKSQLVLRALMIQGNNYLPMNRLARIPSLLHNRRLQALAQKYKSRRVSLRSLINVLGDHRNQVSTRSHFHDHRPRTQKGVYNALVKRFGGKRVFPIDRLAKLRVLRKNQRLHTILKRFKGRNISLHSLGKLLFRRHPLQKQKHTTSLLKLAKQYPHNHQIRRQLANRYKGKRMERNQLTRFFPYFRRHTTTPMSSYVKNSPALRRAIRGRYQLKKGKRNNKNVIPRTRLGRLKKSRASSLFKGHINYNTLKKPNRYLQKKRRGGTGTYFFRNRNTKGHRHKFSIPQRFVQQRRGVGKRGWRNNLRKLFPRKRYPNHMLTRRRSQHSRSKYSTNNTFDNKYRNNNWKTKSSRRAQIVPIMLRRQRLQDIHDSDAEIFDTTELRQSLSHESFPKKSQVSLLQQVSYHDKQIQQLLQKLNILQRNSSQQSFFDKRRARELILNKSLARLVNLGRNKISSSNNEILCRKPIMESNKIISHMMAFASPIIPAHVGLTKIMNEQNNLIYPIAIIQRDSLVHSNQFINDINQLSQLNDNIHRFGFHGKYSIPKQTRLIMIRLRLRVNNDLLNDINNVCTIKDAAIVIKVNNEIITTRLFPNGTLPPHDILTLVTSMDELSLTPRGPLTIEAMVRYHQRNCLDRTRLELIHISYCGDTR